MKNKKCQFNKEEELIIYWKSDVHIVRIGYMELRKQFLDITNIDLFRYIIIFVSVCMKIFHQKYLLENTIVVVKNTYLVQYSKKSISWFNSFENIYIQHALNGGKVVIYGAKSNGYSEQSIQDQYHGELIKLVYQLHGRYWHGCPKC